MSSIRYLVTCATCGKPRISSKNPAKSYAPKVCARCNRERTRIEMARMMHREVLRER